MYGVPFFTCSRLLGFPLLTLTLFIRNINLKYTKKNWLPKYMESVDLCSERRKEEEEIREENVDIDLYAGDANMA